MTTVAAPAQLEIHAKVDDRTFVALKDADGNRIWSHEGVEPSTVGVGSGDYLHLVIDIATGRILNWTPPTPEELRQLME